MNSYNCSLATNKDHDYRTCSSCGPDGLLEQLAALEHDQWIHWSKGVAERKTATPEQIERWSKYWIPYKDLTEESKDKDRAWAKRVLDIISKEIEKNLRKWESEGHILVPGFKKRKQRCHGCGEILELDNGRDSYTCSKSGAGYNTSTSIHFKDGTWGAISEDPEGEWRPGFLEAAKISKSESF